MPTAHTYYLAHRDRTLGERADNEALARALCETWQVLAVGVEPTIVDGVSAWIDDAGVLQVRIVKNATAEAVTDMARVDAIRALMQG
jgi:hypothetical protein